MANGINNSKSMLALNIGPNGVSFEDNFKKAVQKKMAEAREERERQATGKHPGDDFEYVVANNNDNPNDNVNDNLTPEWQKVEQPAEPAANTEGTAADLPYEKVKDNTRQKPEFITPDKPAVDGKYIDRTSANERLNQMVPWREDTKDNVMVSRILEHDKEKDADRLSGNVTDMAINVADSMAEKIAEAGISERTNIAANPFYATDPTAMSGAVAESAIKTSNDYWKQLTPEAVGNHVEEALKQISHEDVFDAAYKAGVSTDWYIGNVLAPKIQQGIYNKLLERHVPKGTLEYVASGAFNSIIGQVAEILYMPAEVRQMRAQGRQMAGQREGIAAEMGNLAVGFAADMPIFKGLGQVVGLLKYGGANKAIGLALDYSRGGLNFGGYNAISALTGAAHQNGKVTGDDMLRTAEEAGKGFVMGTAMGVAGSKLQKGIAGWGQKNGIGLGVKIGTKVAHLSNNTAVMATADMLMNPDTDILSGKDWLEQGKHALMMNVVMDTMHAVEGIAQKPAVPFKTRGIDVQAMKNAGIPVRSEKELYAWLTQPGQSKNRLVEDILKNNKLSLAEKNEVYKLVTGEQNDVMPLNPTLDAAVKRTIDGKWVVQESDALGTVNKRQTFESQEEAEAYRESLQPEIMRNNTEYVEAMDNARNEAISMKEAIDVVAKETGADPAKIKLAIRKNGEGKQLTAEEKAWRDEVFSYRDVYKEYATTTREEAIEAVEIANGMEPGTMENVLKKDYKTLNDTEGKAVRDFNGIMRERLSGKGEAEGVTGAREDLFTPEQRQTSQQKGVELYGKGDHDAMRMQRIRVEQAAERINGVYGADFVNTLDEKGLLAVERLNEQGVELSKEQEGLITDYLNEKTTLETMLENMDSAHKVEIDVARNTVRDMSPSRDEEGNAIVRIAGINGKTYVVRNQVGDSMTLTPVELRADGTIDWSTYNPDNVQSKAWKPGVRYQDVLGSDIMKELAPEYMREYNAIFGERAPEAGMELSMPSENGKMERIKLIGQDAQGNWVASGEMGEYTLADADVRSMIAQTEKAAVEVEKYNERKQQIEAIREELKKHGVEVPETEVQWSRDGYKIDNEGKEVRAGVQETAEKMVEDAEGDAGIALQAVRNKQSKLRAEMDKIRKQHEGETETSKLLEQKKQYEGLNDELEHWNRVEAYYAYKTEAAKEKPLITKERAELMQKFAEKIGSRLSVSDNMYATMLRLYWQTGDKQYLPRDREDANLVNGINLGGNIFINGESIRGLLWAFGHESGHTIAAASRKDYNTYKKAVRTTMGEEAWNKAKEAKRRVGVYGRISDEDIEEEVVNDQIGELFNDPNKFDTFAKLLVDGRAKTGLKTLWDYAKKFAENMNVDGLKEMGAGIKKEWETVTHQFNGAEKLLANTYKKVIEAEENRTAKKKSSNPQIQHSKENDEIFYSNAKKAMEGIKQDKATPEQWLAMLTKQGGIKAGEDKWMGLSDWLKSQDKKSLTREEVVKFIQENQIQIEEDKYSENGLVDPTLKYENEFRRWIAAAPDEIIEADEADNWAWEQMIAEYGEDFGKAFDYDGFNIFTRSDESGDNYLYPELVKKYWGDKAINETRLKYTTRGLKNKKEIALTVPTIESWNEGDHIHFGDAGDGRAIGWIRFGETNTKPKTAYAAQHILDDLESRYGNTTDSSKMTDDDVARREFADYLSRGDYRDIENSEMFIEQSVGEKRAKRIIPLFRSLVSDSDGKRILVIDEIQSKRGQRGRERGFSGERANSAKGQYEAAEKAMYEYRNKMKEKYGEYFLSDDLTEEENKEYKRLYRDMLFKSAHKDNKTYDVPDMPFDKNWHELAMKRMLRYAAENGYDKLAWTTGAQQAERYNIGKVVDAIEARPYKAQSPTESNGHDLTVHQADGQTREMFVQPDGTLNSDSELFDGKNVAEVFGKDIAKKISETTQGVLRLDDENLRVGAEGMSGFYDKILPSFMNKYGKKWGVKVGEVELPNLENSAQKMWAVDITPEMKESVMQGQPMFSKEIGRELLPAKDGVMAEIGGPITRAEIARALDAKNIKIWVNHKDNVENNRLTTNLAGINRIARDMAKARLGIRNKYDFDGNLFYNPTEVEFIIAEAKKKGLPADISYKYDFGNREQITELMNEGKPLYTEQEVKEIKDRLPAGAHKTLDDVLQAFADNKRIDEEQERILSFDDGNAFTKALVMFDIASKRLREKYESDDRYFHTTNDFIDTEGKIRNGGRNYQLREGEKWANRRAINTEIADEILRQIATSPITNDALSKTALTDGRFSKEGEIGQRRLVEAGMDEDNLAIAKEMREAGKTVDVIKLATGWEIGRDGKWRKEAEDLAFTEEGWDTFFKKPVGAEFLLSDVMEFSKLYVAYPKLLDTKLITYFGGGGAFDEETNTIKIGTMELAAGMENAREVIAHEVQHFIQAEEGFAKGGNPRQPIETLMNKEEKTAYKDVLKTINKIEGDTSELLEQREYLLDMSWRKSEYDLLPDFLASEDKKWQPTIWNIKELNREIDEIKKELKTAREKRDEILRSVAKRNGIEYKGVGTVIGTDGYERLAGEVEARSVQRRVNMTPENRRKVLTRVDEDVPPQEQIVYFSKETDPETLKRLDSEETVKVYRAIRVNDDGTLSSPMAGGGVGGKKKAERAETYQPKFGEWEKADEYPELAAMKDGDEYAHITIDKGNGNGTLDVAYNPYIHTSRQMLNDQFSSAWRRPNLQVMEVEVPVSELTSGYKADKAKNAVGETEWTDGVVAKQLEGDKKRKVILTRWDKPVRIVPTEEYAKAVKEQLAGSKVKGIPFNCVTPEQRDALVKEGINILEPEKKAGADAMKAYEEWKRNATTVQGLDGYTEQDVLDIVRGDIEEIFEDAGIDAKIKGMSLNGSRMRGDARKDSDLDVVVEYEGNYKEDAMFNLLNDQPIMIEGVKVDINPITKGKSGTLEQYMERSREYDEEVKDKTRQPLISDGKPIIKAESDETLVQTHDGGIGVQFSKETYEKRGRALLHEQLEKAVERGYMVEREAQEIRDRMELIYQSISEVADMKNEAGDLLFPLFADIQRMDVKVNTDGQYYLSAIMPNHEYPMNIDFSKSCVKREAMNAVLNALVADSRFDATKMTNKDYFRVKELCKKYGLEIPCYGCYVEASRGRTAEWANKVANDWNKLVDLYNTYGKGAIEKAAQMGAGSGTNGSDKKWFENTMRYILVNMPRNAVKIEPADLISPERSANLLSEHPDVYMAIKKHSAQGTPNLVVPDAIYNGEILAPINEEDNWGIDKAYEIGGVRLQSASDFKPKLFFDYSQVLADIASKKLPAHTYTKVPSYAMLFGKTGMKINLSLFPKAVKGVDPKYAGLDANGGYAWSGESFPVEEAFRIQDMEGYDGNVGTMAVGISDAHIWKLLDDARIKSVIPYHSSHLGAFEAERTGMDAATDYTFRQSDQLPKKLRNDGEGWPEYYKRISRSGETTKSQYGKKLGEYLEWRPDWYEYLRKTKDPIAAGKMFVEECQAHGVIPRFPEFVYREDGSFNENYYKLIQDYTTYDKGGNYVRQRAVTLDMPDNWREVLTDALTKEEKSLVGIGNKLPQIVEEFLNPESDVKFSKEIDGKQMVMQSLLDEVADVKKEGEDLAGLRLRPLEKGETCYVQRRYAENKMFSFTGKEKIESMDDVAYIFKQLEDAAVENSFIVLVKDGQPMVIHTGIGNYNETIVNYQHALAAYQKIKPEQVYFVHNHPSGNLSVSRQDLNVLMKLKDMFGSVVKNGIIINTTTGKYGEFGLEGQLNDRQMPDSAEAEIPIKTYSFSKQVFDPDWNPEKAYETASSASIAQFISSHRLGEHKKMNLLVLDSHLKVTGNFFLPWTKISDITSPKTMEAARELSYYVNVAGGTRAALYGNYEYSDAEKDRIKALANRMKLLGTPMLDVLHFDKNAGYHSVVENGEVLFSKEAGEVFDAAVKTFGTTYDIREAGYVLPNGKMLDFSGRHELFGADDSHIKGRRATDHRQISSIAYAYDENGEEIETGIKTTMPEFIRSGAIRIDDNAGYINLAVKPTSVQKEAIRRLVARNDGDVQVEFGDGWDSDHYVEYEGAKPAKVIADIDRYFNEGIKPESDVKFSKEENEFISKYSDNDKKKKIRIANSIKQVSNIRKKAGKEYLLSDEDYVILQTKMKEPVQNFFDATAESIAEDYINEVFGSGKNVIDPDEIRTRAFSVIGYDGTNVALYPQNGELTFRIYKKALERVANSRKPIVLYLTGNAGAGKSTSLATSDIDVSKASVVWDSPFNTFKSLEKAIEFAKGIGIDEENIKIIAIYNDVITSFNNAIKRAKETGRIAPFTYLFEDTYKKNEGKLTKVNGRYPKIDIICLDNSENKAIGEVSLEDAKKWNYNVSEQDYINGLKILENEINNNTGRLTESQIATLTRGLSNARGLSDKTRKMARRIAASVSRNLERKDDRKVRRGLEPKENENFIDFAQRVMAEERTGVDTNPTEAQKEAGNYRKGHIRLDGYNITIENPKGSTRSGKDSDGKEWSVKMNYDYGYIRGTKGVDGDHIDVYLGPDQENGHVFVVDQIDQKSGKFDEHKVMYGFPDADAAKKAYLSQYEDGWQVGPVTEVTKEEFKKWVDSSTRKTKPFSEYVNIKTEGDILSGEADINSGGNTLHIGENVISLQPDDVNYVRKQKESLPKSGAWRSDFPQATILTNKVQSRYPDLYNAAKSGDREAAFELVNKLSESKAVADKIAKLVTDYPDAIVAYPHAEEAAGRNKIPALWAEKLASEGLKVEDDIISITQPMHTGADDEGRLVRRTRFAGEVEKGGKYILLDDQVSSGATLRDMKDYIESRGGEVVQIVGMTASMGGHKIAPSEEHINRLIELGVTDKQLQDYGIAESIRHLTDGEAAKLARLVNRRADRGASQGQEGNGSLGKAKVRRAESQPREGEHWLDYANRVAKEGLAVDSKPTEADKGIKFSKEDTSTENFKRWFGDWEKEPENASKIVDADGKPLVVYHGTPHQFNTFSNFWDMSDNELGSGHYFTNNKRLADSYTEPNFDNQWYIDHQIEKYWAEHPDMDFADVENHVLETAFKDGRTIPAYLNMRNPFIIDSVEIPEEAEHAKENGYDGIVDYGFYERHKEHSTNVTKGTIQYIVFEPNQIKSAIENNGKYDRENPDIRFSKEGKSAEWKKAKEELKDYPFALETLRNLEDQDIYDVAASVLAGGNLLWGDKGEGPNRKKGVQSMMGWKEGERKNFLGMFTKDGMTFAQAGEAVEQACREEHIPFDENDPNAGVNALQDVLGSVRTMGELTNYVELRRVDEARAAVQDAQNHQAEERNQYYLRNYGMSYDEYMTYQEESAKAQAGKGISEEAQRDINWLKRRNERQADELQRIQKELDRLHSEELARPLVQMQGKIIEQQKAQLDQTKTELNQLKDATKRKKNYEDAYRQLLEVKGNVANFIREQLAAEDMPFTSKRELNKILATIEKTNTVEQLQDALREVQMVTGRSRVKHLDYELSKLLHLQIQGLNGKRMSVAKTVDDRTRRIIEDIRGRVQDIGISGMEEELDGLMRQRREQRGDINELRTKLKDAEAEERVTLQAKIDEGEKRWQELSEQIQAKADEISEARESKRSRSAEDLTEEINALISKADELAQEGKQLPEADADKITALEGFKILQQAKKSANDVYKLDKGIRDLWKEIYDLRAERDGKDDNERKRLNRLILNRKEKIKANEALLVDAINQQAFDIQEGINMLETLMDEGRNSLKQKTDAALLRRCEMIKNACADVRNKKNQVDFNRGSNPDIKKNPIWKSFINAPVGSFEYMAQRLGQTGKAGKDSWIYQHFVMGKDGVMEAFNTYQRGLREQKDQLNQKVTDIFGTENSKVLHTDAWVRQAEKADKIVYDSGVTIVTEEGEREVLPLSKGAATYLYMVWKMEDGKSKMMLQGFDNTSMQEIQDFIGKDYMQLADWLQDTFLVGTRAKYNARYRELYNTSMARIDNYVPLRVNKDVTRQESDLSEDKNRRVTLEQRAGSLINRTVNNLPVDITKSVFDVIGEHVEQMENWYAYSPVRRDLDAILSNTFFRNQVDANNAGHFKRFYDAAAIATQSYVAPPAEHGDALMAAMTKGLLGGNIAWRAATAIKQLYSASAYTGYTYDPMFIPYLMKNTATGSLGLNLQWCMDNMPSFRARVDLGDIGNVRISEKVGDISGNWAKKLNKYLQNYTAVGMIPNRLIDAITCSVGAKSIYDYKIRQLRLEIEKDRTLTNEQRQEALKEARRKAVMEADIFYNSTQQSSNPMFLSPMQVSRTLLDRSLTAYQNNNLGYVRKTLEAAYELIQSVQYQKMKKAYKDSYMEDGVPEGEADTMARRQVLKTAGKGLLGLFVMGWLNKYLWDKGSTGFFGFWADSLDDDKKQKENESDADYKNRMEWQSFYDWIGLPARPLQGTPMGNYLKSTSEKRNWNPLLVFNELDDLQKDFEYIMKNDGVFNKELLWTVTNHAMRTGGVNLETLGNIYYGIEQMAIDGGGFNEKMVDLMFALNNPNKGRVDAAKNLYKDEDFITYAQDVAKADKYLTKGTALAHFFPWMKEFNGEGVNGKKLKAEYDKLKKEWEAYHDIDFSKPNVGAETTKIYNEQVKWDDIVEDGMIANLLREVEGVNREWNRLKKEDKESDHAGNEADDYLEINGKEIAQYKLIGKYKKKFATLKRRLNGTTQDETVMDDIRDLRKKFLKEIKDEKFLQDYVEEELE